MGEPARLQLKVRHYEVDAYGHVNHASYVHYFEVARVEALEAIGLGLPDLQRQGHLIVATEITVKYHAPAYPGETLEILTRVREVRGARSVWIQEIREIGGQRLVATAEVIGAFVMTSGRPVRISDEAREKLSTLLGPGS
jgi:acyl-CoA thioester hydrolase